MAIKITCECGKRFKVGEEHAGKRTKCPICKRAFVVPRPNAEQESSSTSEPPPTPPGRTQGEQLIGPPEHQAADLEGPRCGDRRGDPYADTCGVHRILGDANASQKGSNEATLTKSAESQGQLTHRRIVPDEPAPVHRNPKIPVEVTYPILKQEKVSPIKRTVYVRLNMKVTNDVLREIALEIKSHNTEQYQFTYIFYTLPGSLTNAPWAITHFAPTLDVDIMGLTSEREAFLLRQPIAIPLNAKLLGSWIADEVSWRTTIFVKDGEYWLQELFGPSKKHQEGETIVKRLSLHFRDGAMDFQQDGGTDHYLLDRSGNLEVRADDDWKMLLSPRRLNQTGT